MTFDESMLTAGKISKISLSCFMNAKKNDIHLCPCLFAKQYKYVSS